METRDESEGKERQIHWEFMKYNLNSAADLGKLDLTFLIWKSCTYLSVFTLARVPGCFLA